jgi:hypothetical protein
MTSGTKTTSERLLLSEGFRRAVPASLAIGVAGIILAILVGYSLDHSFKRFYFAYLVSFAFFLSISLGALFFVLIQHVTRAGWSVGVRRIAETLACAIPALAGLALPMVVSVVMQKGDLYPWARPVHTTMEAEQTSHAEASDAVATHDKAKLSNEVLSEKRAFLNVPFFLIRLVVYFGTWSAMGIWFWRRSVEQDTTGNIAITTRMQALAAPAMLVFALTFTFASFDLLMSLDPSWFSTIFGVYHFSGAVVAIFATLIVVAYGLQRVGYLENTITREHYHDLGKFLFGFVFFWGYIAFSQYMLLWYANIPETTGWFARRGATTVTQDINGWSVVALLLLFANLFIPFAGLLSRHIKRNKNLLVFWAVWLLVFHWLDLYWLVMPEMDGNVHLGLVELLCFVGIGGVYVATLLKIAATHSLRPTADPRLADSLAFENM